MNWEDRVRLDDLADDLNNLEREIEDVKRLVEALIEVLRYEKQSCDHPFSDCAEAIGKLQTPKRAEKLYESAGEHIRRSWCRKCKSRGSEGFSPKRACIAAGRADRERTEKNAPSYGKCTLIVWPPTVKVYGERIK